jgi:hypothetical protein
MKITTTYIRPPIPTTQFDWMAYVDDGDGEGMPTAYGPTECEALRELAQTLADMVYEKVTA